METNQRAFKRFAPQLKIADMVSLLGAGMTGMGIGANLNLQLQGILPALMFFGVLFMGLGMYGKFQIERERVDPPFWVYVIFGASWIALMVAALYLVIFRFAVIA